MYLSINKLYFRIARDIILHHFIFQLQGRKVQCFTIIVCTVHATSSMQKYTHMYRNTPKNMLATAVHYLEFRNFQGALSC